MSAHTYDAIIVGGRCAGAATAMLMARKGMKVLVAERSAPGSDTVSSHNMTRGAVIQLARWGLARRLMDEGTPWIDRMTFHFGDQVTPVQLKPAMGAPGIMGTRRTVLDKALAEAAREAGAEVRYHTSFRDVVRDENDRVIGAVLTDETGIDTRFTAPLVVGADGIRSTVARRVGAEVRKEAKNMLGHIYAYTDGLPLEGNHAYFAPGVSIASTPTNGGEVVIASVAPDRLRKLRADMDDRSVLLRLAHKTNPEFGAMLAQANLTEPVRAFAGTRGFVRDCAGPGWALVGDAGYFRDPVSAHGMTDAFRDAELLANAAQGGDVALAAYQGARDEVTVEIWELTDRIAAFDTDLAALQIMYRDLAQAMRTEQDWMFSAFDPVRAAA